MTGTPGRVGMKRTVMLHVLLFSPRNHLHNQNSRQGLNMPNNGCDRHDAYNLTLRGTPRE